MSRIRDLTNKERERVCEEVLSESHLCERCPMFFAGNCFMRHPENFDVVEAALVLDRDESYRDVNK